MVMFNVACAVSQQVKVGGWFIDFSAEHTFSFTKKEMEMLNSSLHIIKPVATAASGRQCS